MISHVRIFIVVLLAQSFALSNPCRAQEALGSLSDSIKVQISNPYKQEMLLKARIRLLLADCGLKDALIIPIHFVSEYKNAAIVYSETSYPGFSVVLDPEWFENMTEQEQKFIIAHEASHYLNRDPFIVRLLLGFTAVGAYRLAQNNFYDIKKALSLAGGVVLGGVMLALWYSRHAERVADWFAVTKCGSDGGFAFLNRYKDGNPDSWKEYVKGFFSTHPSMHERMAALKSYDDVKQQAITELDTVPSTLNVVTSWPDQMVVEAEIL